MPAGRGRKDCAAARVRRLAGSWTAPVRPRCAGLPDSGASAALQRLPAFSIASAGGWHPELLQSSREASPRSHAGRSVDRPLLTCAASVGLTIGRVRSRTISPSAACSNWRIRCFTGSLLYLNWSECARCLTSTTDVDYWVTCFALILPNLDRPGDCSVNRRLVRSR